MNTKLSVFAPVVIFALFSSPLSLFGEIHSGQFWLDTRIGWEFAEGPGSPGTQGNIEFLDESKRFVLNYDFEKGGEYVSASRTLEDIEASESLTGVEMLVWGPGGPVYLALVDSTDQVFTYLLGDVKDDNQHALRNNLEDPESVSGGAGDKKMHFPLKGIRLIIKKAEPMTKGKVTFERIALTSPQYQLP